MGSFYIVLFLRKCFHKRCLTWGLWKGMGSMGQGWGLGGGANWGWDSPNFQGNTRHPISVCPACVVCNVCWEAELVLSFERACGPLPDSRMWFYLRKREKNPCWDQCERP